MIESPGTSALSTDAKNSRRWGLLGGSRSWRSMAAHVIPGPQSLPFVPCSRSTMRWSASSSTFPLLWFSASPWINRIWMDALKSPKPCYRIKPALGGSVNYFATVTRTLVQPSVSLWLQIWILHRTKPKRLSRHMNIKTCSSKCPLWVPRSWQWDRHSVKASCFKVQTLVPLPILPLLSPSLTVS